MAISEQITRLQNAKINIKTAIETKGVIVPEGTIDTYPDLIAQIQTQGKYQSKTAIPSKEYQVVTPDEGYDALSRVLVAETPLEEKTVTPSRDSQTVLPSSNKVGLSQVIVNGDENLFPSVIKKDVTIFGVTGTYEGEGGGGGGGSYEWLGSPIDIEAQTTISVGDRIVATKNTSATAKTISTSSAGATLALLSGDLSVGFPSMTITDGAELPLYMQNEFGTYEQVSTITIEGMASAFSGVGIATTPQAAITDFNINYDGTIAIAEKSVHSSGHTNGSCFLVINIDKENKSGSFHTFEISGKFSYETTKYDGLRVRYFPTWNFVENVLIGTAYNYPVNIDGTTDTSQTIYSIFIGTIGLNGDFHQTYYEANRGYTSMASSPRGIGQIDEGVYLVCMSGGLIKFTTGGILGYSTNQTTPTNLTANGKYAGGSSGTYRVNDDLSLTAVVNLGTTAYPSEDGAYALVTGINGYVYEVLTRTRIGSGNYGFVRGTRFTPTRWVTDNNKIHALVPSTDAEYLAKSITTFAMEENKIYGVASESLIVGGRGKARGLFNTTV